MLQFADFENSYKPNQKDGKIVIFGAGTVGRLAHLALKDHGIEIDYFCDSDKRKQKHKIHTEQYSSFSYKKHSKSKDFWGMLKVLH